MHLTPSKNTWLFALTVFLSFFISTVSAQQIPISVEHSGNDSVGKKLAYYFKDLVHSSSSLYIATDEDSDKPKINVLIQTMERQRDGNLSNLNSIYSVIWLWKRHEEEALPIYLTSTIGYCGTNVVKGCAEGLIVDTAELAEEMQELIILLKKAVSD